MKHLFVLSLATLFLGFNSFAQKEKKSMPTMPLVLVLVHWRWLNLTITILKEHLSILVWRLC